MDGISHLLHQYPFTSRFHNSPETAESTSMSPTTSPSPELSENVYIGKDLSPIAIAAIVLACIIFVGLLTFVATHLFCIWCGDNCGLASRGAIKKPLLSIDDTDFDDIEDVHF